MSIVLHRVLCFTGPWRCRHGLTQTLYLRRTVGKNPSMPSSGAMRESRWSTTAQQPGSPGGNSLGPEDGRSMDRSPPRIPKPFNVLATPCAVGKGRNLAHDLAGFSRLSGRKAQTGLEGVFCGRELLARQKRGLCVGPTKKGKGTKWMGATDGKGIPVALHLESASRAEIKLLETTLAKIRVPKQGCGRPKSKPQRVIADKGYDSDPHRKRLLDRGIRLIVPYKTNSRKRTYEDGRELRRYRKRYKVERSISWFGNYRRLLNRFENKLISFYAFFHVACIMIVARWF